MDSTTTEGPRRRRLVLGAVGLGIVAACAALTWVFMHDDPEEEEITDEEYNVVPPCTGPPNYNRTRRVRSATQHALRIADTEPRTAVLIAASAAHVLPSLRTPEGARAERTLRELLATLPADELMNARVPTGDDNDSLPGSEGSNEASGSGRRPESGDDKDKIKLASAGSLVVGSGGKGGAIVWELRDDRLVERNILADSEGAVEILAIAPTGRWVATAGHDQSILVWDISEEGQPGDPKRLEGHRGEIRDLVFSSDGERLFSYATNDSVREWSVGRDWLGTERGRARVEIVRLGLTPDDRYLFAGDGDGVIYRWDLDDDGGPGSISKAHDQAITTLAFSPDSKHLLSADRNGRLWTVGSGPLQTKVLRGHSETIISASFSADGNWLATASRDGELLWWSLNGGDVGTTSHRREEVGGVEWVSFSPLGDRLYSGHTDGTVQVRDPWNEEYLHIVGSGPAAVSGMVMLSPGDYLVTASLDGSVRVSPASARALIRAACEAVGRGPTEQEWASWLPGQPYEQICS
ncbi:WD40 repeat domain-containing protein [Enhygromyxa salina]|nr:WD40 repeat domain-containing protein [Enhygromyxa salina]